MMAIVVALTACGSAKPLRLGDVTLHDAEYPRGDVSGLPQYVTLTAEIDNSGGALRLKECRFWLYYNYRKVALVELDKTVKIARNSRNKVEMRLHIAVARNSQTMPLRRAIEQGEWENVQIGWEAKVRRGLLGTKIEQSPEPIEEVLSSKTLGEIREQMKDEKVE